MSKDDQEALTWTEKLLRLGMDEVVNHLKRLIAEKQAQAAEIEQLRGATWDIDNAARVLAECMDYPWSHMPETGRENMRKHAVRVVHTALNTKEQQP